MFGISMGCTSVFFHAYLELWEAINHLTQQWDPRHIGELHRHHVSSHFHGRQGSRAITIGNVVHHHAAVGQWIVPDQGQQHQIQPTEQAESVRRDRRPREHVQHFGRLSTTSTMQQSTPQEHDLNTSTVRFGMETTPTPASYNLGHPGVNVLVIDA